MKLNAMVNVGVLLDAILERFSGVDHAARSLGISTNGLNALLNFNGEAPRPDVLRRIVSGLGLTNERLFIPCPPTRTEIENATQKE
jgi:hypothetical protein